MGASAMLGGTSSERSDDEEAGEGAVSWVIPLSWSAAAAEEFGRAGGLADHTDAARTTRRILGHITYFGAGASAE